MASALAGCGAAQREPVRTYTPAEQRMLAKFGNISYRLIVDAARGQEFIGVDFYQVGLPNSFFGSGKQTAGNPKSMDLNGPIPEQVRIIWRDSAGHGAESVNGSTYNGKIIGDEVIDVGARIPQEVIDDLQRDPRGQLRLKFRMSGQGTLLGWDIERRPGYSPARRDEIGRPLHVEAVHTLAGGDFREAQIFNGKVVRPGWYIDRKTGRKMETDY